MKTRLLLLFMVAAVPAYAQNAAPNLDNEIHSNPAAAGFRTSVSFNLAASSYQVDESYYNEKTYQTRVDGSQVSMALLGESLKTEIGYASSKTEISKTASGSLLSTTQSTTPLIQSALLVGDSLAFGAGYMNSRRDYTNLDNSSLDSIRNIERIQYGTVINIRTIYLGYYQFRNDYSETQTTIGFAAKGYVASVGIMTGSFMEQGIIEYARTNQDPVSVEGESAKSGIDLGEVSGYSLSFNGISRGFLFSVFKGEQTAKQSRLFEEILDEIDYSITMLKLGYQPKSGFSLYVAAVQDESEMSFLGNYRALFGSQFYTSRGTGAYVGIGYTF